MVTGAESKVFDLLVIGGGVNGCGIARDAAGRGLSVVLCEKGDLAQATSSSSTKLFHGGLRYLEHFEFRLVREALIERETLLKAMPHIAWPLRFVLPVDPQLRNRDDKSALGKVLRYMMPFLRGRRPAFMMRTGLFVYDHLGGRDILPGTKRLNLRDHLVGLPLQSQFAKGFEYSDCWIEDARLVVLNAKDAARRGAVIMPRVVCEKARREQNLWQVQLRDLNENKAYTVCARGIVNAGGPWVEEILQGRLAERKKNKLRLVRGSHIVTHRLFDHDQPYLFQLGDGRVIFAIPYESDYTLIGTTEQDHTGDPGHAACSDEEKRYLLDAINGFFATAVTEAEIVWTYSGVRPLYDDKASGATATSRDYVLTVQDEQGKMPLLNVFGGKITTYRKMSEEAMRKIATYYPQMRGEWTATAPLPGGDFPVTGFEELVEKICKRYSFMDMQWARVLARRYGTEVFAVYADATTLADLGQDFGARLYACEVEWLIEQEWAQCTEDILWRRTKLGLRLDEAQQQTLSDWMATRTVSASPAAKVSCQ